MNEEELKQKILYLKDVICLSFRQIAKQVGISRTRVIRLYRNQEKPEKQSCFLEKYFSLIKYWYHTYPELKARQVYTWLKERDVKMSYTSVVRYTKQFRQKKNILYHSLTFLPGEEAQVDWFFYNQEVLGKLYGFVFILSYSRYMFAHMFPRTTFEFFIEGHLKAFSDIGGVPKALRYDNLKSVVIKRKPEIQYNPRFLEFCRHYGIEIRLCNPGKGNEKGRVERAIRTIKESFLSVSQSSSLDSLNQSLYQWVSTKNHTLHRGSGYIPVDCLPKESLKPLPELPWNNISIHPPVKTTKTGMMIFDTNAYSVPDYLVGKSLSIHASPTMITIYHGKKRVASHPRSFQRHMQFINPLHRSYSHLSNQAKLQRIYDVIKRIDPLLQKFLIANETCGEDPLKTAYTLFKLFKNYRRGMLISIAHECMKRNSPRLKTFLSYFTSYQEQPHDSVQPQNIDILRICYKPRPLEDYDDTKSNS